VPEVSEACAVGVPDEVKGEVVWLFCVPQPGVDAGNGLGDAVRAEVVRELGKAFAPAEIRFVPALPKTRTAKIVRRAVRAAVLGEDPGDLSSLEDASVLDRFRA
jgi:acetyl-CoA synthetase